jgi:parallel beta-helix repeat protein
LAKRNAKKKLIAETRCFIWRLHSGGWRCSVLEGMSMRQMLRRRLAVAIMIGLMVLAFQAGVLEIPEEVSALTPHAPIYILGNGDFTPANGVTGGSGTPSDPYIIEGWEIYASGSPAIEIRNTTAHFVIRDSYTDTVYMLDLSCIYLNNVSNGAVKNVTVEDSDYGIHLYRSSNNTVANNTVADNIEVSNWWSINIEESNNNKILNNTLSAYKHHGIFLYYSSNNTVANNMITDYFTGIGLDRGHYNILTNNTLVGTSIAISGGKLEEWNTHIIDTTNVVNGKPVYYWKNRTGGTLPLGAGEIILANCTNVRVENENISDGSVGIMVGFSSESTIANFTAWSHVWYAIYNWFSSNITIINSTLSDSRYGLYMGYSVDTKVVKSSIEQSRNAGIDIWRSRGTIVRDSQMKGATMGGVVSLSDTTDTVFLNTEISDGKYDGITASKATNLQVVNCTVSGNQVGIEFTRDSNNATVVNSTFSNNSNKDFRIERRSNATALNTTFSKTKVRYYWDSISNLTVKWFAHVKVIDINDKPVAGADVEVREVNDDLVFKGDTSPDGYVRWIETTEYYQNDTNLDGDGEDPGEKIFHTPHNITVSRDGCVVYADPEPYMDQSREIVVKLQCVYATYTITKSPVQGNVTIDGLEYPAPVILGFQQGSIHTISVNSPENQGTDARFFFEYWDDGGAQTHDISVGTTDEVITAFYRAQYRPTITLLGLAPTYTVTVYHTKDGLPDNDPGVFDFWSDWCDNGTSLSIDVDAVGSTATERWHTYTDFANAPWISVTSPFTETVVYYHQYKPAITLVGTDSTHYVTAYHTEGGSSQSDLGTFNSWSDWCDEGTPLSFDTYTSGSTASERRQTYTDFNILPWNAVASAIVETVIYHHQFKVNITVNGLILTHPATITVVQGGNTFNPTTYTTWSDWADSSTTLSVVDTVAVSLRERYHTAETVSWIVSSALTVTVNYTHQYMPIITLIGTNSIYTVSVIHTLDRLPHDDSNVFGSWSDWTDNGSALTFDECTTGTPTRCTTDVRNFTVNSAFDATITYAELPRVNYTITKSPLQGNVIVDGFQYPAPAVFNWVPGEVHNISVTSPEYQGPDTRYIFEYWDDGGAQTHDIIVGSTDMVITAYQLTQYKPSITLVGLDPFHTVTVYHTNDGILENDSGVYDSWSDWCDNGTSLTLDSNAVGSSTTERWHTYRDFSVAPWTSVTSPFVENVVYFHQYKPSIALIGTDTTHSVTAYHFEGGGSSNDPGIFDSWSDWCDEGTSLSFDTDTSGSTAIERWHTYRDFTIAPWISVASAFAESIVYHHQYKPAVSLDGTDMVHGVTAYHTEGGFSLTDIGTFGSWNDWCDEGSSLSFDADTSGSTTTERWHTYTDFGVPPWSGVTSAFAETVTYYHQFKVTIATNGLIPSYPATITVVQGSTPSNPTTDALWSDWADADSGLSITDVIAASSTERFSTIDATSWIVNSASTWTVDYFHQYEATITAIGLVSAHPATITLVQYGSTGNPTTQAAWSDWADDSSTLSIVDTVLVSGTERYSTIDTTSWTVNSAITSTVDYYHQFKANLTVTGLIPTHTATITAVQGGTAISPTTYTTWSDWADAGSTLSTDETLTVSARERYHTVDTVSWTVDSALHVTVNYTHQYMPMITLIGTNLTHTVDVTHTLDGLPHDDSEVFDNWSEWADEGSHLAFSEYTSGEPRLHTTDTRAWSVDAPFDATITYVESPDKDEGKEENYKPMIALIFCAVLAIIGGMIAYRRPLRLSKRDRITRNRLYTAILIVLPFAVAEALTGLLSSLVGVLCIPPWFNLGMVVDSSILAVGLVAQFWSLRKAKTYEQD